MTPPTIDPGAARRTARSGEPSRSRAPARAPAPERAQLQRLGALIREARRGAGLSQATTAAAAGLHVRTVQRLEAGDLWPRPSTLCRLAAALRPDDAALLSIELLEAASEGLAPEAPRRRSRAEHSAAHAAEQERVHAEQAEARQRSRAFVDASRASSAAVAALVRAIGRGDAEAAAAAVAAQAAAGALVEQDLARALAAIRAAGEHS